VIARVVDIYTAEVTGVTLDNHTGGGKLLIEGINYI